MPILDTDFLIALHQEDEAAVRRLVELQHEPLYIPAIVAVEFLTPFGPRARRAYEELGRAFTLVATSPEWVMAAANLRHRLRKEGRSIRLADFWIATWAVLYETPVVTRNAKDFRATGVDVIAW